MPRTQQTKPALVKTQPIHKPPVSYEIKHQAPTFGQTIKQGFGFGLGNAIAHRLFSSIPSIMNTNDQVQQEPVKPDSQVSRSIGAFATQDMSGQIDYMQCMKEGGTDESCKQYLS
jgi:hypothetical protein